MCSKVLLGLGRADTDAEPQAIRSHTQVNIVLGGAAAAVALILVLSGCTPSPPIYARLEDGVPTFMVCSAGRPTSIEVKVADRGTVDYGLVLSTTGSGEVPTGSPLTYGVPWSGWQTDVGPLTFDPDDVAISLVLVRSADQSDLLNAVFAGWDLTSDHWIDDQGVEHEPCR